ncbi:MAG: PspA/IM30 family protein [Chloroflexota bacterium]|jgi:phage shock protein A
MINRSRQDIRSRIIELKRHLVAAMADEQKLYQRCTDAGSEASRWRQRAELAVDKGEDALARGALARANHFAARAAQFEQQYLEQKGYVERMKARLRALEAGVVVEEPVAVVQLPDVSELEKNAERLEQMEERAREQRAMLAAWAELERDELSEKLAALEREDQLERQLAELKQRLGRA